MEIVAKIGTLTARVLVPKSQIVAVRAAPSLPLRATTVQKKAKTVAPVVKAPADKKEPVKAQEAAEKKRPETDWVRLRALMKSALKESLADARAPASKDGPLPNPMPQALDPTFELLYGPLSEGVFRENYIGLMYREGVLPRARGGGGGFGFSGFLTFP